MGVCFNLIFLIKIMVASRIKTLLFLCIDCSIPGVLLSWGKKEKKKGKTKLLFYFFLYIWMQMDILISLLL